MKKAIKCYIDAKYLDKIGKLWAKSIKECIDKNQVHKSIVIVPLWQAVDYHYQQYNDSKVENLYTKLKKLMNNPAEVSMFFIHGDKFDCNMYNKRKGMHKYRTYPFFKLS